MSHFDNFTRSDAGTCLTNMTSKIRADKRKNEANNGGNSSKRSRCVHKNQQENNIFEQSHSQTHQQPMQDICNSDRIIFTQNPIYENASEDDNQETFPNFIHSLIDLN